MQPLLSQGGYRSGANTLTFGELTNFRINCRGCLGNRAFAYPLDVMFCAQIWNLDYVFRTPVARTDPYGMNRVRPKYTVTLCPAKSTSAPASSGSCRSPTTRDGRRKSSRWSTQ